MTCGRVYHAWLLFQRFIEIFSAGVEHGHAMAPASDHCCVKHYNLFSFFICIALHALLEGTLLAHGHGHHATDGGLLLGMMLHKFLEAIALMSVLSCFTLSIRRMLYSLATPVGLGLSSHAIHYTSDYGNTIVLSIVTGNFLYILATMLFEASSNHQVNQLTLWVGLLGAGLAALVDFFILKAISNDNSGVKSGLRSSHTFSMLRCSTALLLKITSSFRKKPSLYVLTHIWNHLILARKSNVW